MAYKAYNTTGGLFTIIQDDAVYNYFHTETTGNIVDRDGNRTAVGDRIWSSGYLDQMYCSVYYNGLGGGTSNISINAYNRMMDFFPLAVLRSIEIDSTTNVPYTYDCIGADASFIINWRIPAVGTNVYADLQMSAGNLYSGQTSYGSGRNFFGHFNADTTRATFANTASVYLYVFNSTLTAGMLLTFLFRDGSLGYYTASSWSRTNLTMSNQWQFLTWLGLLTPITPPSPVGPDPYEDFPNTEPGGGEPNPDPLDDDILEEALPTTSFADAGFCRIYRPNKAQINALASYMWTDSSFLQTVLNHAKQMLEDPIESIISLSLVPCVPDVLPDEQVKVMYIPITGVQMPPVANQFVRVDCGTVLVEEMYGSALDYNPYTKVQLYLPYIGTVQLDTDEVMKKTLHVVYRIDVVTGLCCASVSAVDSNHDDVLYQFSGHCSISQPLSAADFSGYINAALAAGKLVAGIAAAGAGAPGIAGTLLDSPSPSISNHTRDIKATTRNPETGRQVTAGTVHRVDKIESQGASFGEMATRGVTNTVGAVMGSKTTIQHTGGFAGNSGYLAAVRRPYLIITRPRIANPLNYGKYNGRPSMLNISLGTCTGFTQVQSIQLTGINATNPELSELSTLLMSGVIF